METIYLSLGAQEAVGTFFMKSPLSKYPPVVLPHEEGVYSDEVELFVNPKISGEKAVGLSPSANVASSHLQTK